MLIRHHVIQHFHLLICEQNHNDVFAIRKNQSFSAHFEKAQRIDLAFSNNKTVMWDEFLPYYANEVTPRRLPYLSRHQVVHYVENSTFPFCLTLDSPQL